MDQRTRHSNGHNLPALSTTHMRKMWKCIVQGYRMPCLFIKISGINKTKTIFPLRLYAILDKSISVAVANANSN